MFPSLRVFKTQLDTPSSDLFQLTLFWAGGVHFRIQSTPIALWFSSNCYNSGTHCFWSLWTCSVLQQNSSNKPPLHKVRNLCNSSMVWTFSCHLSSDTSDLFWFQTITPVWAAPPESIIIQVPQSTEDVTHFSVYLGFFISGYTTDSCHTVCLSSEQQVKYMAIRWQSHIAKLNLGSLIFLINSSLEGVLR